MLSVAVQNIALLTDNDTYTGVMTLSCGCIRGTKKSIDAPAEMHMSIDVGGRLNGLCLIIVYHPFRSVCCLCSQYIDEHNSFD